MASKPLWTRKINILFLGGSNTMMKRGYADETVKALGEFFDIGRVDNLAAGGTSVGMGLWTTLELGARITKNHAPMKPRAGFRTSVQTVAASKTSTRRPCHHTSAID